MSMRMNASTENQEQKPERTVSDTLDSANPTAASPFIPSHSVGGGSNSFTTQVPASRVGTYFPIEQHFCSWEGQVSQL